VLLRPVTKQPQREDVLRYLRTIPPLVSVTAGFSPVTGRSEKLDCELSSDGVHARASSNYEAIGPKPMTICSRRVQLITHRTTLSYLLHGRWIVDSVRDDFQENRKIHISLEIERGCNGFSSMVWRSHTLSTAWDHGRVFQGRIRTAPRRIACGP